MNLLIYLLYGQDKSFDIQSLKPFKSLKAYKYFFDGYIRNVWLYLCPCDNDLMLKVLYFCAYVNHSQNCDALLEVFISMNAENENVYSAQCSCISVIYPLQCEQAWEYRSYLHVKFNLILRV